MSRLVLVSLSSGPTDDTLQTIDLFCRRGLASASVVRCLVPSGPEWTTLGSMVRSSVPLEPILPPVPALVSDSDTAVLEYLCDLPWVMSEALRRARLHPADLLVVPEADPVQLLGLAAWLDGTDRAPAVVVGVTHRDDTAPGDWARLHRLAARRLSRSGPTRLVVSAARQEDFGRLAASGYPILAPGEMAGATSSVAAGLLPRAPAAVNETYRERAGGLLPVGVVRRALGLPVTGRIVVVWGEDGAGAARALAALPWASQLTCLAVGAPLPDQKWPFTLGQLPTANGLEQKQALAAVGDLHVMPTPDADPGAVAVVMAQGRPLLCPVESAAADHLDDGQLYAPGGLEWHLAGLLLRPELLRLFGARNLKISEDMQCVSAS